MGKVYGNWVTGLHSGRACKHDDIYTKVNKKTGQCYSVKLCNPNTNQTESQKKTVSAFGKVNAAVAAWIKTEKAKSAPSEAYQKVVAVFNRQNRYATLRGMIIAKGMYKVENGEVVVDPNANTTFATISSTVQLPAGSGSANSGSTPGSGSAPAGGGSGSQAPSGGSQTPSGGSGSQTPSGGSQAPSGGGSDTGGSDGGGD